MLDIFGTYHINPATPILFVYIYTTRKHENPLWSGASTIRYPLLSQRRLSDTRYSAKGTIGKWRYASSKRKRDGDMQEKKLSDFLNGLPLTICRYEYRPGPLLKQTCVRS